VPCCWRREALSVACSAADFWTSSLGFVVVLRGGQGFERRTRFSPTRRGLPTQGRRLEGGRKVGGFGLKASQPVSNGEVVRVAFAQVSRQNRQTVSSDGRRSAHYGCIPEVAGSNPAPATRKWPLACGNAVRGPLGFLSHIALCRVYVPETSALAARCGPGVGARLALEAAACGTSDVRPGRRGFAGEGLKDVRHVGCRPVLLDVELLGDRV